MQKCALNVYNEIAELQSAICTSLCPLECDNIQYSFTTSSSDFPGKNLLDLVHMKHQNLSKKELTERLTSFRVYYQELKYTLTSQVFTINVYDMVTSIGGAFGLFIGGSILSILEIIYGSLDVLFHFFKKPVIL